MGPEQPELPAAAARMALENANALEANEAMLQSDPSIGKDWCQPPASAPRLPPGSTALLVPATGKCLALCCVAARDPEEWSRVPRQPGGNPVNLSRLAQEDIMANDFLLGKVGPAGMAVERVGSLVMGENADFPDMPHLAAALGGAVGV